MKYLVSSHPRDLTFSKMVSTLMTTILLSWFQVLIFLIPRQLPSAELGNYYRLPLTLSHQYLHKWKFSLQLKTRGSPFVVLSLPLCTKQLYICERTPYSLYKPLSLRTFIILEKDHFIYLLVLGILNIITFEHTHTYTHKIDSRSL